MKYFTLDRVARANDWFRQSDAQRNRAEKEFFRTVRLYHRHLESIERRLPKAAYAFFRFGFAETGLHDARLLRCSAGDGIDFQPDGKQPFYLNQQRTAVRIEFLNYEQCFHYIFTCKDVRHVHCDLQVERYRREWLHRLGDLFTYEIVAADNKYLALGFLFAEGGTIEVEFRKLMFRRKRIQRRYPESEMYR